uniref:Uncharacterized protein n=1 Tax=Mus musculus TaxID=10090 RepID=Q3V3I0_MOUSE|nr:unnamed protein product [Mus musculus]
MVFYDVKFTSDLESNLMLVTAWVRARRGQPGRYLELLEDVFQE